MEGTCQIRVQWWQRKLVRAPTVANIQHMRRLTHNSWRQMAIQVVAAFELTRSCFGAKRLERCRLCKSVSRRCTDMERFNFGLWLVWHHWQLASTVLLSSWMLHPALFLKLASQISCSNPSHPKTGNRTHRGFEAKGKVGPHSVCCSAFATGLLGPEVCRKLQQ